MATGRRTGWSRISSARFSPAKRRQIRNPNSVRPWQHVLEALGGYVLLAERLLEGRAEFACGWNFGPSDGDTQPVSWIVREMLADWGANGDWRSPQGAQPHEAVLLRLDCSKARAELGWQPRLCLKEALGKVIEWHKAVANGASAREVSLRQIEEYEVGNETPMKQAQVA